MRILIIDDSEVIRQRLKERLAETQGIELVGEAKDVNDAINAIECLYPDLVVLDIRMPGGNGISVLETINKNKKDKPIVIVFTNYPYLQYRKKCLDAGANYFFYKSLEFEKLIQLVGKLAKAE